MLNERIGKVAFWFIAIGIQVTYFGQFWEGFEGMARRVAQYNPKFEAANQMSTIGAYILMSGWLIFLYMMLHAWRRGKIAPANPWHAKTLEWKVPTPVPLENFLVDPVVTSDPYTYGEGVPDGQEVPEFAPVHEPEPELVPAGSAPPADAHEGGGTV